MSEPTPEDQAEAIKRELFAGNKIAAIKIYHDQAKVGLAEAKTAVEKMDAELRQSMPGSFTAPPAPGCSARAMMGLLILAGIAVALWRAFH